MTRQLWLFWWLVLAIKLVIAAWLPLANDEAYYWTWSLHPQLSYFDHPGMIAWLMYLGGPFIHLGQAVRWPTVLLGHLSVIIWMDLLKDRFSSRQQNWFFALFMLAPLIGPGSVIVTPDVPLLFFWSLSIWFFLRALSQSSPSNYLLLGLCMGLGFCAKYHMVLFVPGIFLHLWWTKAWRQVKWKYVPLTIAAGLIGCSPVLIWNWQNHFASFEFQLNHGLGKNEWTYWVPIIYVAGQLALLAPTILSAIFKTRYSQQINWLKPWAFFPILFFGLTSLRAPVEANWTAVAYPAVIGLAAGVADSQLKKVKYTFGAWVLGLLLLLSYIIKPWGPIDPMSWKTKELYEYTHLESIVEKYQPLYASSYQMAAKLHYLTKKPVYKIYGMARWDDYDFHPEAKPTEKTYYVLVNHNWSWETPLAWQGHHKIDRYYVHPEFDVLLIQQE